MIVMQLTGGMGNQMFQYALGRHLAIKLNTTLKLDLSFFKTYEWHEYSLLPFNLNASIATDRELKAIKNEYGKWEKLLRRIMGNFQPSFATIEEQGLQFDRHILDAADNSYLLGYWQSEKYFIDIKEEIIKDFTLKIPPSIANQSTLDQIHSCNSVSLHIRRGVYATVPEVNKAHGLSPLDYYYKAIAHIQKQVDTPHIFVFSDEISWAKENLQINIAHTFVDQNNDKTDYEDLRMMSNCKHNILANSTFSWWAAWLNSYKDKIVIAPQKWYNDTTRNTQDLIPEGWVRL